MDNTLSETFLATKDSIYLNTAGTGLIPSQSFQKKIQYLQKQQEVGSVIWEEILEDVLPTTRASIAQFLGAEETEIAFTPNFSVALNYILPSLKKKKNVLLYKNDYPSLNLPFTLNEFNVFWLEEEEDGSLSVDKIEKLVRENKIDIVALSHSQYKSGFTINLMEVVDVCQRHHCASIIDGTQTVGALPVDVKEIGVDVYISSTYKWMLSGFGAAVMYISSKFFQTIEPKVAGYGSFQMKEGNWIYEPSVRSYEPGHLNYAPIVTLQSSLNYLLKEGLEEIRKKQIDLLSHLTRKIMEKGLPMYGSFDALQRVGIVSIYADEQTYLKLRKNNIVTTFRDGTIRISPYMYNTKEDIDALLDVL